MDNEEEEKVLSVPRDFTALGVLYTLLAERQQRVVQHRLVLDSASYKPRQRRSALPTHLRVDVGGFVAPEAGVLTVYLVKCAVAESEVDDGAGEDRRVMVKFPWNEFVDSDEQGVNAYEAVQRTFTLSTINEDSENVANGAGPQSLLLLVIVFRPSPSSSSSSSTSSSSSASSYSTSNGASYKARELVLEHTRRVLEGAKGLDRHADMGMCGCVVDVLRKVCDFAKTLFARTNTA